MNNFACLLLILALLALPAPSFADLQSNNTSDENETKSVVEQKSSQLPPKTRILNETDRGKLLYENHCSFCHSQSVHDKNSSKVHTYQDIQHWVMHWSNHLDLQWNNDDINTVTDYLNREFYHLPPQPLSPDNSTE